MWNPFRKRREAKGKKEEALADDLAMILLLAAYKAKGLKVEEATLAGGRRMVVHAKEVCLGDHCTIHRPSSHHMVAWPQNWRQDIRVMERICPHGVGHPDPDEINPYIAHGCCPEHCCEAKK